MALVCLVGGATATTLAAYSDSRVIGASAGAGVWEGSLAAPSECSHITFAGEPIVGTAGDDFILGTDQNDLIYALDGNDIVFGGKGDDCLVGGAGHDFLGGHGLPQFAPLSHHHPTKSIPAKFGSLGGLLEEGRDVLLGGDGDDGLFGGRGDDDLYGGPGNDILVTVLDGDRLFGESGQDLLTGVGALVVDGGASISVPDVEVDTCLLFMDPASYIGCEKTSLFGGSPLAADAGDGPESLRSEGPPESADDGEGEGDGADPVPGDDGVNDPAEGDEPPTSDGVDDDTSEDESTGEEGSKEPPVDDQVGPVAPDGEGDPLLMPYEAPAGVEPEETDPEEVAS